MAPLVMGVLNVTPDSFYDGGRYVDHDAAVAHGLELVAQGADVVDVGGESTRPGAAPVAAGEELRRVLPVVAALAPVVRVSIDTSKALVAREAVAAGATLVNDVSAGLAEVAAATGAGWVAMHMQGTPAVMQRSPHYDDVVSEVASFLAERARVGERAGVGEVWIDPGIGFGKTLEHNLSLLAALPRLVGLGWPLLVGTSRKGFLGRLAAGPDAAPLPPDERLEASVATAAWAFDAGAAMVRVHDVRETVMLRRLLFEEVAA
jgi:dihydropteroate synthase